MNENNILYRISHHSRSQYHQQSLQFHNPSLPARTQVTHIRQLLNPSLGFTLCLPKLFPKPFLKLSQLQTNCHFLQAFLVIFLSVINAGQSFPAPQYL